MTEAKEVLFSVFHLSIDVDIVPAFKALNEVGLLKILALLDDSLWAITLELSEYASSVVDVSHSLG